MPERVFGSGLRGTAIWDEDRPKTARPVPQILNLDDRKFHLDSRPLSTIFSPRKVSLSKSRFFISQEDQEVTLPQEGSS